MSIVVMFLLIGISGESQEPGISVTNIMMSIKLYYVWIVTCEGSNKNEQTHYSY